MIGTWDVWPQQSRRGCLFRLLYWHVETTFVKSEAVMPIQTFYSCKKIFNHFRHQNDSVFFAKIYLIFVWHKNVSSVSYGKVIQSFLGNEPIHMAIWHRYFDDHLVLEAQKSKVYTGSHLDEAVLWRHLYYHILILLVRSKAVMSIWTIFLRKIIEHIFEQKVD